MQKVSISIALYIAILCVAVPASIFAQSNEADLSESKISIKMDRQPLGVVFRYLMQKYEIPLGFEQSILNRNQIDYLFDTNLPGTATHRQEMAGGRIEITTTGEIAYEAKLYPITLDFEDAPLKDVFDQLVFQMDNYTWEINDGVVNIFPTKGRDERFEKLLGLNIKRFTFEKGKTVDDITKNIALLPEFRSFLKENNLTFIGVRQGTDFLIKAKYGRSVSEDMDFSNLTFRDLLNKCTKIKKGGWIVRFRYHSRDTGKDVIDIDI